jgi:hypothetical protein
MSTSKPRVIKDFDKIDNHIQEQIKLLYPDGFSSHLISFTNKNGDKVSALPYEAEDKYYLIRMTVQQADAIIEDDDDYDDDGYLKEDIKMDLEDKYVDLSDLGDEEPADDKS